MADQQREDQPTRDVVEHGPSLVLVTAGILAATLMQTLDTTIVNVALPVIQGNLGATLDEGAWVVTGYIISAVIVIPLTPWLQLRFGRRQYYATAVIGFTIASMFCGIAGSIGSLIFWRIVQGAFGGGLIATAQATLRDTFPRDKLGMSQAIFALGAIVGPSVGPTLGGWLTDNFSWNYVFFINVVPGIFAGIVILMRLKNPTDPRPIPVDAIGLALLAVGLGSLQYILDEGQRNDWFDDPVVATCGAVALLGCIAFVIWELWGTDRPIVDLRALRYRAVAAGSALGLAIGSTLYGAIVILPQYLEGVLGFTATESGELIFARAAMVGLFTPVAARLAGNPRLDTRILLVIGFIGSGASQIWLSMVTTPLSDFTSLLGPALLGGASISLLFVPISIAVLAALPPLIIPKATAFQSLSLQLGGSLSTAALVTLIAQRQAFHQEILAGNTTLAHPQLAALLAAHGSLAGLYQQVLVQANALSFADAQFALGLLSFALLPVVFLLPRKRHDAGPIQVSME